MTKKTNFKKHLLASASVLAIGAVASQGAMAAQTTIAAGAAAVVVNGATNGYLISGAGAAVTLASGIDITSDGTATANQTLEINNGGSITIANGGSVSATTTAMATINFTTAGTGFLTNSGLVRNTVAGAGAGEDAVVVGIATGAITNAGTISTSGTNAGANGIQLAAVTVASILNSGTITAVGGAGINAGTATLTSGIRNTGSIGASAAGGTGITIGAATFTAGGISNLAGTISSTTGAALNVTGTITSSAVGSTSSTTTDASLGTIYNTGTITSTAGTGAVTLAGVVGNYGTFSATSGANAGLYNAGTITDSSTGIALLLNVAGTNNVTNASGGLIGSTSTANSSAISVALDNTSGTILNAGTIQTTTGNGLLLAANKTLGTLKNTNSILVTTGNGVNIADGTGKITDLSNSGTISASGDGSAILFAGAAGAAIITNTKTITAGNTTSTKGAVHYSAGSTSTAYLNNSGTVSSTGASGKAIYMATGTTVGSSTVSTTGTNSEYKVITAMTTGINNSSAGVISGATSASTVAVPVVAGLTSSGTSTGTAIDASVGTGAINVTNAGTINGDIRTGSGGSNILLTYANTLSGTTISGTGVYGNIILNSASDVINFTPGAGANQAFSGTITGTISGAAANSATTSAKGILTAVNGNTTIINTVTTASTIEQVKAATVAVNSGATLYLKGAVPTVALPTVLTATSTSGVTTNNGTLQLGARTTHTSTGVVTGNGTYTFDVVNLSTAVDGTGTLNGRIVMGTTGNTFNGGASVLVNGVSTGTGGSNGAIAINFSNTSGTYQRATAGGVAGSTTGLIATTTAAADLTIATYSAGASSITYANGSLNSTSGSATSIGTSVANGYVLGDNSYVLKFVGYVSKGTTAASSTTDSTDLRVAIIRDNVYQASTSRFNEKAVGTALEAIGTAANADTNLQTHMATLDAYSSAGAVESALKTLDATTQTSGATTQTTMAVQDAAIGTVESRMEVARAEMSGSGVATGGKMNNSGVWGEVFGSSIDQGFRKDVDGYQADVGGFSIGADTAINNEVRIGAAFAYGNTNAEGTRNNVDVDSFQGSIYGTYDMGKVFYEGVGAFTYNSYDSERTLYTGSVAKGSFNGQQYSAKGTAGYKVDLNGGLKVTPFVSAQYTFLTQDDYTETGSTANLHVATDDINIFKTGIGTKLAYPIVDGGTTYTPRVSGAWYYDLVGDEVDTTSNFTAASGTTFISKGAEVAQSSFRLGAGLDILAQDNVTVSLDYNWDTKQDFEAHSGALKARFEF